MKGFEMALWPNENKEPGSSQPDATGFIAIPIEVLRDLSLAYQQRQLPVENDTRNNLEIVKLGASAWKNDPNNGKRQPVIKAQIRNLAEQKEAIERQAAYRARQDGGFAAPAPAPAAPAPSAAPAPAPAAAPAASGWDMPF